MSDYANTKTAYQVFRKGLGSLSKEYGFKRVPHMEASWYKSLPTGGNTEFAVVCDRWGSSDRGNEFNVCVYCGEYIGNAKLGRGDVRSASLSELMGPNDLKEMEKIQNAINARRPFPPAPIYTPEDDNYVWFMSYFQPVKTPYTDRIGSQISFSYYSIQDLNEWIDFISARIFPAIENFLSSPGFGPDPLLKIISGR